MFSSGLSVDLGLLGVHCLHRKSRSYASTLATLEYQTIQRTNSPSIADIDVSFLGIPFQFDECLKPFLQISSKASRELGVGQQAVHRHTIACVLIFIEFPRGAKEIVDGCFGPVVPADRQLASLPLQPQH